MHDDLLPCPYCGAAVGEHIGLMYSYKAGTKTIQVICQQCGTRGPYLVHGVTAHEGWNRMPRIGPLSKLEWDTMSEREEPEV